MKKQRFIICLDCGVNLEAKSPRQIVCRACSTKRKNAASIKCQRRTRDKYPNGRTCADCGKPVNKVATRCAECQADHKRETWRTWEKAQQRNKDLSRLDGCGNNKCDSCPFPDCILPAENDELPGDWYEAK